MQFTVVQSRLQPLLTISPRPVSLDCHQLAEDSSWRDSIDQELREWSTSSKNLVKCISERIRRRADFLLAEKKRLEADAKEKHKKIRDEQKELEAEKAAMRGVHKFQSTQVKLNVGGHPFTTSRTTLTSHPGSML